MTETGLYFTIGSKFFQFSKFGHIIKQTLGKITEKQEGEGLISPFEAICIALGGSIGVANIGGVATAVAVGGPGAVFWMWMSALLGIGKIEPDFAIFYEEKKEKAGS